MNLHEYQAKQLFSRYGIPIPAGQTVRNLHEARNAAHTLGGNSWIVKAQIQAGGRGKAGGVKRVYGPAELEQFAGTLLGTTLATHQSSGKALPVNALQIEAPCAIARELYVSALIDRGIGRVVFIASASGGMDIEEVAASKPESILKIIVDPIAGLQPYQCRQLAFGMGLDVDQGRSLTDIMLKLYRLFIERDLSLVEINPLVVTQEGALLAIDAKINIDDNALHRQPDLAALRDPSQEEPSEYEAQQHGLNYVKLDGNIGCMVNGAGLAMATMDIIKLYGGEPANFLDVGGGTTADKVAEAFKIIVGDSKIKGILVNIFGGIVRCDLIAEGLIKALKEVSVNMPIVVRLEGTNAKHGLDMLESSGLDITTAGNLTDAAKKIVHAVKG